MSRDYLVREATSAASDIDALVRHRIGMFTEMEIALDRAADSQAFHQWFSDSLEAGAYRAWLAVTAEGQIVAGGGIAILPWPPGPAGTGVRLPFVYNVYTDPPHRRRGLARRIMNTIHAWCLDEGYRTVALAASRFGEPLYTALGYRQSPHPYMFLDLLSSIHDQPRRDARS